MVQLTVGLHGMAWAIVEVADLGCGQRRPRQGNDRTCVVSGILSEVSGTAKIEFVHAAGDMGT